MIRGAHTTPNKHLFAICLCSQQRLLIQSQLLFVLLEDQGRGSAGEMPRKGQACGGEIILKHQLRVFLHTDTQTKDRVRETSNDALYIQSPNTCCPG